MATPSRGPTARFSALPERHDGESAFDIELHFSAAPEGLSYKTVGGGLLAVTGGTVEKARRKTARSNIAWVVTIRPSGPGDIAIRLPARACGEANAVCFDNRPLARGRDRGGAGRSVHGLVRRGAGGA